MRLRAVLAAVLVLVLVACDPPPLVSPGGGDVPGITTTGLTTLLAGEEWRYVGATGEPAFESGWENAGIMSDLAFRIVNAGTEVRIYGAILDNGASGTTVTTLPEGYRPDAGTVGLITVSILSSLGAYSGSVAVVGDDGTLNAFETDTGDTVIINGSFPITPPDLT